MKLLIITQKVDINDDVLGFFHRWLEDILAKFRTTSIFIIDVQRLQNQETLS